MTIEITHSVTNENKRKYKVGDKFSFSLKNGESVTALAVKEETDGMVFIFEDCLSKAYPMNDNLMDMLNNELYKLFPDKIRDAMVSFDGNSMIRIQPVFTYFKCLFSIPKWVSFLEGPLFYDFFLWKFLRIPV